MKISRYYRIDLEYVQRTSLLVAATSPDEANDMVAESIDPTVRGFQIIATTEISEEDKDKMLHAINEEGRVIH